MSDVTTLQYGSHWTLTRTYFDREDVGHVHVTTFGDRDEAGRVAQEARRVGAHDVRITGPHRGPP